MNSLILAQMGMAMLAAAGLVSSVSLAAQRELAPRQEPATIKVTTDLVLLNVTVTDQRGRVITGLKKEQFKVLEDGVEQPLSFFSLEKVPVSWGLVLDRSGSMSGMIENVYRAAVHVVDEGTEEDEAFIVTFSERSELISDFVSDRQKLRDSVSNLRAGGRTALWDAVAFALDHLRYAEHRKKVMVVITDGEDNHSLLDFRELVSRVEEEDVLIYTVGMFESGGLRSARKQLSRLAEATGAQAHFPANIEQCRKAMDEIARDVSQQYQVGYYPANRTRDGSWRRVKVILLGSDPSRAKYVPRTRPGYYAPKG